MKKIIFIALASLLTFVSYATNNPCDGNTYEYCCAYSHIDDNGLRSTRYVGYNSNTDFAITQVYEGDSSGTHYPVAWGNTLGKAADPCKIA